MDKYESALKLMAERGGRESLIAIATMDGNKPRVRMVDGYYEDGAYYVVTYTLSNKMKQIAANKDVAVCDVEWITANGAGENLGHVLDEKNAAMMLKVRKAFEKWYSNGHVNEKDPNTCLLRIKLTNAVITDHAKKYGEWQYAVDFEKKVCK